MYQLKVYYLPSTQQCLYSPIMKYLSLIACFLLSLFCFLCCLLFTQNIVQRVQQVKKRPLMMAVTLHVDSDSYPVAIYVNNK